MKLRYILKESHQLLSPEQAAAIVHERNSSGDLEQELYDWFTLSEWAAEVYPPSDGWVWYADVALAGWYDLSTKIRSRQFQCEVEPTDHELKVGGIKRDGKRISLSITMKASDFAEGEREAGVPSGAMFNFLQVGFAIRRSDVAHNADFDGMTPYIVGSITGTTNNSTHHELDHWFPDFKYLDELTSKRLPKFPDPTVQQEPSDGQRPARLAAEALQAARHGGPQDREGAARRRPQVRRADAR